VSYTVYSLRFCTISENVHMTEYSLIVFFVWLIIILSFVCYFMKLTDNILYICVLFVQLLLPFHYCNCILPVS